MTNKKPPRILMCPPDHFGVDYIINPWMIGQIGAADTKAAWEQWAGLRDLLEKECGARIELVTAQKGLPDIVFTANAGLVKGNRFVPSRFFFAERRGEEPVYTAWFAER